MTRYITFRGGFKDGDRTILKGHGKYLTFLTCDPNKQSRISVKTVRHRYESVLVRHPFADRTSTSEDFLYMGEV